MAAQSPKTLLNSNQFKVMALTRSDSTGGVTLPGNVIRPVMGLFSPITLVDVLKGQDAVIFALNHVFLSHQRLLDAYGGTTEAREKLRYEKLAHECNL